MSGPLRVAIEARLSSGASGGVEQVVSGLAYGLSRLTDGDEEYLFLSRQGDDWLQPYLGGGCRALETVGAQPNAFGAVKQRLAGRLPRLRRVWQSLPAACFPPARPNVSDGTIEQASVDVMHFPFQRAFLTPVPSIYHPHDLQHLHLPQFFSRRQVRDRERLYRSYCGQAALVAVATRWTQRDLIDRYDLAETKVRVVPLAPPIAGYPQPSEGDLFEARRRFDLPPAFVFYPAQTWAHKNHLRLLDALAYLRDRRGLRVSLVCCGQKNAFIPTIERHLQALQLQDQVRFLGFISAAEVAALYRLALGVVLPTLFEGGGLPIGEAFFAGAPLACSSATCLPEQVGDAALLFDPEQPESIAEAVARLWTDEPLRRLLAERGRERVRGLSWERTARIFRAHYRRLSGRKLRPEDRDLIEEEEAA